MSNAVQRFYDNKDEYLTKFATHFWLNVATRFAANPRILGYELINEPWIGDVFAFPELYAPKACDAINLKRVYALLHDVIRSVGQIPNHRHNLFGLIPFTFYSAISGH